MLDGLVSRAVFADAIAVVREDEDRRKLHKRRKADRRRGKDLETIERVTPDAASFSESVTQANYELVKGYKRIRNEF